MARGVFRFLGLLFCFLLTTSVTQAIIIRHDKADTRYRVDNADYPQLFYLHIRSGNKICVATLIESRWALTAAHCTRQTPLLESVSSHEKIYLSIAGKDYRVESLILHPQSDTGDELHDVDLALIGLDRDIDHVTPASLYRQQDEVNQVFSLMGWGYSGIGTRGQQSNDGRMRRALNRVVKADQWLEFFFDDPRQSGGQALELEGVPGLGDSGGPALLETPSGLQVAGIAIGELEEGDAPERQGLYGSTQLYERVSSHLEWIESTIRNH